MMCGGGGGSDAERLGVAGGFILLSSLVFESPQAAPQPPGAIRKGLPTGSRLEGASGPLPTRSSVSCSPTAHPDMSERPSKGPLTCARGVQHADVCRGVHGCLQVVGMIVEKEAGLRMQLRTRPDGQIGPPAQRSAHAAAAT